MEPSSSAATRGYSLAQSQWKRFWQQCPSFSSPLFHAFLRVLLLHVADPYQRPGCLVCIWGVLWGLHLLSGDGAHLSLQEALPVLLRSQQAPRHSYFNEQESGSPPVQAVSSRTPQRLPLCIWIALAFNAFSRFTPACEASQEHFESTWPIILATLCPLCISLVHRMNSFTSAVWTHTSLFQNCLVYFSIVFKNIP